eukprot:3473421-Pyramimonas_sp.AAC.1
MTSATAYHVQGKRAVTAVFGNLEGFDMNNTPSEWIREKLTTNEGPIPRNMYTKGAIENLLLVEVDSILDRDTAVALIRSLKLTRGDKHVWATPDRAPTERAARNFCFGLKYMLKETMRLPYIINVIDENPY